MESKTIITILSIALILGIGFYVGDNYLLPDFYDTAHAQGEIAIVADQVKSGVVYWANETGGAVRVPVGQFCQFVLNQGGAQWQWN